VPNPDATPRETSKPTMAAFCPTLGLQLEKPPPDHLKNPKHIATIAMNINRR
jgi:hypothetical protein